MNPWGTRRALTVKSRHGMNVIIVTMVYRGMVLITIDPPFTTDAILDPAHVDNLIATLTLANEEARSYKKDEPT
ncbi:MAG: hypothetical protein ACRDSP_16495 [Pseudonocardiaceae bacterium]